MTAIRFKRLLFILIAGFSALIAVAILAYFIYQPWREEVDEAYNSIYHWLVIDPTMNTLANKRENIAYCGTTTRLQKLDVYIPKHSEKPAPVVIQIHGGGWTGGDKANAIVSDYGTEIVKHGMALISINYRLAPTYTYPAQNQDVECALTYLIAHARELNIDMTKVGLFGDSAGGQLAAMASFDSTYKGRIKAVVEFFGTSDIWAQITRKPYKDRSAIAYIGSLDNQALAKQASPLYATHIGAPPFLLFHGTNDHIVHYDQSANYAKQLRTDGVTVTLQTVENANHNFTRKSIPNKDSIKAQTVAFFTKYLY